MAASLASLAAAVEAAAARVYQHGALRVTPLEPTRILGSGVGSAFLKLESEQVRRTACSDCSPSCLLRRSLEVTGTQTRTWQVTGSFKARGAVNAVAAFLETSTPAQRKAGIVAASSGNHARGVAAALQAVPGALGIPASIFVPSSIAPVKIKALREMVCVLSCCLGTAPSSSSSAPFPRCLGSGRAGRRQRGERLRQGRDCSPGPRRADRGALHQSVQRPRSRRRAGHHRDRDRQAAGGGGLAGRGRAWGIGRCPPSAPRGGFCTCRRRRAHLGRRSGAQGEAEGAGAVRRDRNAAGSGTGDGGASISAQCLRRPPL